MSNNEKLSESIENGKVCCLINVEEIKYIYLIKKSVLSKVNYDLLSKIMDMAEFEEKLLNELQNLAPFILLTNLNYGDIVNTKNIPDSKYPEIYRIFENYHLWEKRYIQNSVSLQIKRCSENRRLVLYS